MSEIKFTLIFDEKIDAERIPKRKTEYYKTNIIEEIKNEDNKNIKNDSIDDDDI